MQTHVPQIWHINRSTPIPLYKQLADNIKWSIYLGNVGNGWKLPSIRTMAKELDISIDTVRAAYKILEDAGLAIARPHHGTEVIVPNNKQAVFSEICVDEEETLINFIERCYEKGMSEQQIKTLFNTILERESQDKEAPRVLFVECNEEDGKRFREQLSSVLDIRVDIVMLNKLDELCTQANVVRQRYKAVITTFFHYSIVMQQVQCLQLPVYGVVTEMSGKALQQIRSLPAGSKIGVVLQPNHSVEYLLGLITAIREDLDIRHTIVGDKAELDSLSSWADLYVVAHPCEKEVFARNENAEVLYFCDSINAQSIGILRENLNYLLQE